MIPAAVQRHSLAGRIVRILEVSSFVAGAFGLGLTGYQLYRGNEDRRIEASLAFAAALNSGVLSDQKTMLDRAVLRRSDDIARMVRANFTEEDHLLFLREKLLRGADAEETAALQVAVVSIDGLFDQIEICIRDPSHFTRSRCDPETLESYFCGYAIGFTSLYGPFLEYIGTELRNPLLGTSTKSFAARPACNSARAALREAAQ